jgi:hypothetical protein
MPELRVTVEGDAGLVAKLLGWKPWAELVREYGQADPAPALPCGHVGPDGEWLPGEGTSDLRCAECGKDKVCRITRQTPGRPTEWRCNPCSRGHYVV